MVPFPFLAWSPRACQMRSPIAPPLRLRSSPGTGESRLRHCNNCHASISRLNRVFDESFQDLRRLESVNSRRDVHLPSQVVRPILFGVMHAATSCQITVRQTHDPCGRHGSHFFLSSPRRCRSSFRPPTDAARILTGGSSRMSVPGLAIKGLTGSTDVRYDGTD